VTDVGWRRSAATEGPNQSLAMQDYLRAAATGERSYDREQTATNLAAMRAGVQSQLGVLALVESRREAGCGGRPEVRRRLSCAQIRTAGRPAGQRPSRMPR